MTLSAVAQPGRAAADPPAQRFALAFHVARDDVRTREVVERWIGEANRLFSDYGICFAESERRVLGEDQAELHTIGDRRRLRRRLVDRAINVFVVDAILDPRPSEATKRASAWMARTPSGRLSGAHVPADGQRPATYIILAAAGVRSTLAHELGHFFGVGHHRDPANIMSYGAERIIFDERQAQSFRARARRYARTNQVRVVSDECGAPPSRVE